MFPLGEMRKEEVRAVARDLGLPTAEKPESQELCFVQGDWRDLLRARAGASLAPGTFVDRKGNEMGRHGGAALFTVGQRRGLGLAAGRPLYVTAIDAASGRVTLGDPADLDARTVLVGGWNPVSAGAPLPGDPPLRGRAKVRRNHPAAPCAAEGLGGGRVRLRFDPPVRAAAPGQSAVLYDEGGWVLGGGWIEGTAP